MERWKKISRYILVKVSNNQVVVWRDPYYSTLMGLWMSVIIWHICELWMMKIRHFCVIFRRKKDDMGKKFWWLGLLCYFCISLGLISLVRWSEEYTSLWDYHLYFSLIVLGVQSYLFCPTLDSNFPEKWVWDVVILIIC